MSEKEDNRKKYPEIARFVDTLRSVFGEDTRVISLEVQASHESSTQDAPDDQQ